MIQFSVKDFRGFHEFSNSSIRPITFLIGENSAGKSSFLAGFKFVIDFSNGSAASFNQDPFQLGTFQQVAHHRGGRAGRVKEFQLGISGTSFGRRRTASNQTPQFAGFQLFFKDIKSQAGVHKIELRSKEDLLRFEIANESVHVAYEDAKGVVSPLDNRNVIPPFARLEFHRYWRYILQDFHFAFSRRISGDKDNLGQHIVDRIIELANLGEGLIRELSGSLEATSAIRTKPLRTYTPGQDVRDGEGSHVPFELAKLSRDKNKDAWKRLKGSLEAFGQASEMFKEVGIKSFGANVSDPFQIQFSSGGPKTNIVDLGYGTSQVLPILYAVAVEQQGTRFLIQQPEVHLHPKAQAALGSYFVNSFTESSKTFIIETHSDFIVDRIRQAIAAKIISASDATILFFERERLENKITQIDFDEEGSPIRPPDTYRSFFMDEQLRILGVD